MIGEIRGYDMVASYFAIVAFLKIVLHLTIGYLELIATYFELLFVGSLCSLIGLITLGNADSGPMLLRALLWSAAGAALLEPTLLAFLAGRYPRRNTTSLGVVIGASTLLALLFSAMLASLAPPITAAATLETYRQFTRYLLIAPGLMLAVYGALIAYYGEGHGYRLLARVRWPMNTTLSALLVWGFIGCFSAIVTTPPSTDLQGVVRSYLVTKTFDYVFGPFWSPFGWIAIPAIVLFSYIAIVILFKLSDHTELARSAFSLLFTLALFTIWVQPWLTLDGLIWNLITSYFKLSFFLVMDVLTTAGWYLSMRKVHQALDEL
jgi:hypothetical protein